MGDGLAGRQGLTGDHLAVGEGIVWDIPQQAMGGGRGRARFLFAGLSVAKVDPNSMAIAGNITNAQLGFPPAEDCLVVQGDNVYVAGWSSETGRVYCAKVEAGGMTVVAAYSESTGEDDVQSLIMGPDGFIYMGDGKNHVWKLDPGDMSLEGVLHLGGGKTGVQGLAHDGTWLYAGLNMSPARIVKVDPAAMAEDSTLTLSPGNNSCRDLGYDGASLYALLNLSPGRVVKVDPAAMAEVATLTFGAGENGPRAMAPNANGYLLDGPYLYAGLMLSPGRIARVNLAAFAEDATATLNPGENLAIAATTLEGSLYVGLSTSPAIIVKMTADMARIGSLTFPAGEDTIASLAV